MTKKPKITQQKTISLPARVTKEAHEVTPDLCEMYAKELGLLIPISRTDAISRAVLEAVTRRKEMAVAE